MPARYKHTRDQSAEILRIAVAQMGRHDAAFYPTNYAIWYEYSAGTNNALRAALDQRLAESKNLTDSDVLRLYLEHVVAPDEAAERLRERVMTLLRETSEFVTTTGTHAVQFGESLESSSQRLQGPPSVSSLREIVGQLLSETQQMCAANALLSRQLNSSAQEIQTLTQRLEKVETEALLDPLTELLNRRGFERTLTLLSANESIGHRPALLLIDVDHFKHINDTYGHLVGDQVLCAIAKVLRARTKGSDVAARLGGDEFVLYLPGTPLSGAVSLAEQIRANVALARLRRIDRDEYVVNVSVSIGATEARENETLEELLLRADGALYNAKQSGRNCIRQAP